MAAFVGLFLLSGHAFAVSQESEDLLLVADRKVGQPAVEAADERRQREARVVELQLDLVALAVCALRKIDVHSLARAVLARTAVAIIGVARSGKPNIFGSVAAWYVGGEGRN